MTHVLLVEDDLLLARQFMRVLERADMVVSHARHAGEALAFIDATPPDAIILDMLLPATSGFALLHELQSYFDTAALPIIVCTSMADTMTLEELRPYGVYRLLDKMELVPQDLVAAVRAAV